MKRKQIIKNNAVSSMYTFQLGGFSQKVLAEGKSKDLPVVLTLHGGPGTPVPFSAGCRGMFPEFTDKFIMVYWDQLGCGINNREIDDSFSIDSFVQMTADLLREIKKLFPDNKLYLFATSWGSILSAKIAEQYQDKIDGAVVAGQIVERLFFNEEVLKTLERANIPKKKLEAIRNADTDHITQRDLQLISSCLRRYTDAYQNKKGKQAPMGKMIGGLLTSPDYSFRDFKAVMVNGYRENISLWREILKIDLSGVLKRVKIPYQILQGDTDLVTPTKFVKELVEAAGNPYLKHQVIENTGHLPGMAMMEEVYKQLYLLAYQDER